MLEINDLDEIQNHMFLLYGMWVENILFLLFFWFVCKFYVEQFVLNWLFSFAETNEWIIADLTFINERFNLRWIASYRNWKCWYKMLLMCPGGMCRIFMWIEVKRFILRKLCACETKKIIEINLRLLLSDEIK